MDWHNFKVLSIYGVLSCVFLFIIGKGKLAILSIIIYPFYGLVLCIKEFRKKKKLSVQLEDVSENIKRITICHIMKRGIKLKKSIKKNIISDISEGNYRMSSALLIEKRKEVDTSGEDYDYFLAFDNKDQYEVYCCVYESAHIGDRLWVIATTTDTMKVIQSGDDYFNMFEYRILG